MEADCDDDGDDNNNSVLHFPSKELKVVCMALPTTCTLTTSHQAGKTDVDWPKINFKA